MMTDTSSLATSSFDRLLQRFNVEGVDLLHMFYADGPAQLRDVDGVGGIALQRLSCGRVILVPCHAGGGIVQDEHGSRRFVVHHVHQGVDACM